MSTDLQKLAVSILETERAAVLEFETIEAILVTHKICSTAELFEFKKLIEERSAQIKQIDEAIKQFLEAIKQQESVEYISKKLAKDPTSLTDEEKKQLFASFASVDHERKL